MTTLTDEQIAAFEGLDVVQAKFYFDRPNADGRTHRQMVEALLSASKPAAPPQSVAEDTQHPYAYIYEFDTPFGVHRELQYCSYNGSWPKRTVLVYAEPKSPQNDAEDAKRYQFLKRQARYDPKMDGRHVWWSITMRKSNGGALVGRTLDAAIDSAMSQQTIRGNEDRAG